MKNLYDETVKFLLEHGKLMSDVVFVSGNGHEIPLDNFIETTKAYDYDYDIRFGNEEVPIDLLVVGKDWWIERHGHDGSEWWEYKTIPKKPKTIKTILAFHGVRGYLYGDKRGVK